MMISVITPVYNGERFIESCFKVVLKQNCPSIEHIIVDGCSKDKTVEIIRNYGHQYPHIRWISEPDKGQSDALNKGIKMANGSILAILNVDDYYEPNVLNRVLEIFKNLPEPSLIVGNCNVWDAQDRLILINKPGKLNLVNLLIEKQINKDNQFDFTYSVNPSAYFYHKSLHDKIGLYLVEEHYTMDIDFLMKTVQSATVKYFDETWGNFRKIPGTKTLSVLKDGTERIRHQQIFKTYVKNLSLFQQIEVSYRRLVIRIKYFSKYPERLPQAIKRNLPWFFKADF